MSRDGEKRVRPGLGAALGHQSLGSDADTAGKATCSPLGASTARPGDEEIARAVLDQRAMVIAVLRSRGVLVGWSRSDPAEHPAIADAMGEIAEEVMRTIPRFLAQGEVSLVRWATGVAKNVLARQVRDSARRAAREEPLEDSLVGTFAVIAADEPGSGADDAFFLDLISAARDRIAASGPTGIAQWNRLVRLAVQPRRGRAARERLRAEMAEISGLPPVVFGQDTERNDEGGQL
ncbi:hypothetical protein GCM10027268_22260 [Brachybacterium huguangmaarense]